MNHLDEDQAKACYATEPRIIVTANPGAGKSRLVVSRIAHMIDDRKISAHNIIAISFTRMASNELKNRLGNKYRGIFLGTFHSFALKIIEMYGSERGWNPEYITILDEDECLLEEERCLKDVGIIGSKNKWKVANPYKWDQYKEMMLSCNTDAIGVEPDVMEKFIVAWRTFNDHLRAENVLTFGTMMLEALALINGKHGDELRNKFQHILVDEAQDTNRCQYSIIEALKPKTLFVVGDKNQSIYSWRGAKPELFMSAMEGATMYQLSRSYRFGVNIASAATNLIRNNDNNIDLFIEAISENKGTVQTVKDSEYSDVAEILKEELKTYQPRQIAVLARRHATLERLSGELQSSGIPFLRIGGDDDPTKTAEFRVLKGMLRMAVNELDNRAFMAASPAIDIPPSKLWDIRSKAAEQSKSLIQVYKTNSEIPKDFDEVFDYLTDKDDGRYNMVVNHIKSIVQRQAIADTPELVKYIALTDIQDRLMGREDKNEVTLQTIHGSKGLEYPVVLLLGMNKHEFPSPRSIREGNTEEELRLAFVGYTRAEEKLYLVSNVPRCEKEGPSMFFDMTGKLDEYKKQDDNLRY